MFRHLPRSSRALFHQRSLFGTGSRSSIPGSPQYRNPKTFIIVEMLQNKPGELGKAIQTFEKHGVNMTHIESRLKSFAREGPSFYIDFEGREDDQRIVDMLSELRFPTNIRDLDLTTETLDGGTDLIADDHPGFKDQQYKDRRVDIVRRAQEYSHGQPLPVVDYNAEETETWSEVYKRLKEQSQTMACDEYLQGMDKLERYVDFRADKIPQIGDISDFLHQETGFRLRPISGLLSARDFLNALAFRVFFSTQYIRHHGNPFYTPEPDICHELMGHVPMFADRDFADFSQLLGLASLGASDEEVDQLASCYWFTVEFGLLKQHGEVKAFGAGLLSSFGEMEWSTQPEPSEECRQAGGILANYPDLMKPEILPFEPVAASKQAFPITTYQPLYFCAESLSDAKHKLDTFCDLLNRPFHPQYDPFTESIVVSKAVKRESRTSTLQQQADKQREFFETLKHKNTDDNMA